MIVEEKAVCPYCWESIYFEIDTSISEQEYVEDCHVCCNPILLRVNFLETQLILKQLKKTTDFKNYGNFYIGRHSFYRSLHIFKISALRKTKNDQSWSKLTLVGLVDYLVLIAGTLGTGILFMTLYSISH